MHARNAATYRAATLLQGTAVEGSFRKMPSRWGREGEPLLDFKQQ